MNLGTNHPLKLNNKKNITSTPYSMIKLLKKARKSQKTPPMTQNPNANPRHIIYKEFFHLISTVWSQGSP